MLLAGLIIPPCRWHSAVSEGGPPSAGKSLITVPNLIIHGDDRTAVEQPDIYPYSAVAYMDVICECGCGWECSGTAVENSHTILTAAHSVYCSEHSSSAESIVFYFGYHNYRQNLYRYDGKWSFTSGTTFPAHEYSFVNDWAVIRLDEELDSRIIPLPPAAGTGPQAAGAPPFYRILGYSGGKLYADSGPLTIMDDTHFEYAMDQDTGASGGPILTESGPGVGIIIGHREEDDGTKMNVGYRLTPEILDAIHNSR